MNSNEILFMDILSASFGIKPSKSYTSFSDSQWQYLFNQTFKHNLSSVMFTSVKDIPTQNDTQTNAKLTWKKQSQLLCIRQALIYDKLNILLKLLNENNIPVAVLKGPALARYFPDPLTRVSGDIDLLLLDLSKSQQAMDLIKNIPDTVCDTCDEDTFSFTIEDLLHIELHFSPFAKRDGKFFESFSHSGLFGHETMRQETILDINMLVPMPTDMLVYIVCHMAQHFVYSGFGIRHIIDFWLFIKNNYNEIDFSLVEKHLCSFELLDFYRTCLTICVNRFNFTDIALNFDPKMYSELAIELLEDIICAGVYGYSDNDRVQSGAIVKNAYKEGGQKSNSMLKKLFPSYQVMARHFPYCKKYPVMLPVAYIHRFLGYRKKSGQNLSQMAKTASKVSDISTKRIELLEKLSMLSGK